MPNMQVRLNLQNSENRHVLFRKLTAGTRTKPENILKNLSAFELERLLEVLVLC